MAVRLSPVALAVAGAVTLAACGGGGGGSSSTTTTTPASVDVTVTPSLGQFSTGCTVELRKSTGEALGSATVGTNGKAVIPISSYTGAVIATVKGSDTCTYFDEASGTDKPFGPTKKLAAVVDNIRQDMGVNILTNLAASKVLDTSGTALTAGATTDTIKQENATVQVMFQVGDMFAPPTLLNSSSGKTLDSTEAGKLAAKLAALAEVASSLSSNAADLAATLADDLKDGTLDSIDNTRLQAGLAATVTKYADDTAKASLEEIATGTSLTTDTTAAKEQARTALAAGTSLQQAKQIFADLRTSILSISNNAGTGSLDKQNAALKADFQNGVDVTKTFDNLTLMVNAVEQIYLGSATSVHNNTGSCGFTAATAPTEVVCLVRSPETGKGYRILLRPGADGVSVTWEVTHTRDLTTNVSTALSGLTGTMSRDLTGKNTLKGNFYPMTADGARTAIDTSFTYSGTKGTQLWSGSGTLDTLKSDGTTSTLKVAVTEFTADEAKKTAKLVGALTGPHHRFDGSLEVSDLTTSLDGNVSPKSARFVGSFTDISTATPFKFLEGTLTASQDQSAYNGNLDDSASNFVKVTIGFNGTAYKSAGVTGIGLTLSVTNTDGYASPKGEFTLTGLNGLSLTGKATPVTDGFNWEIKNSNGITLTYVASAKSGTIKNADGTSLGSISNQRASFIDGTYESLI
ncbi:hypothetical protein GCM10007933_35440 [Zoogloea oryzae]|uniref:Lipoprotein n=1 Tax=Zoogloea oryzae TaxID=310767 RepID=A0ABQ6FEQ0_9RHOO|nr:hypothetical protein [Zoogloea oryzae]GLT24073.1 hypothetical protein GCM10007933_35440 [Zoogloea oryzae]